MDDWKECEFKIEFENGGREYFKSYNDALEYSETSKDLCHIYFWDDEYMKWSYIECR